MKHQPGGRAVRVVLAASMLLVACGGLPNPSRAATTATPTPSAADLLAKPALSTMNDMHFTATVRVTTGAQTVELTGEGDMVVRPSSAFHMVVKGTAGGVPVSEEIITKGGMDYVRDGTQKFRSSPSTQASDVNTWRFASDAALIGDEALPTGKAWHLKATSQQGNPFEAWVRTTDGYLLRYVASSKTGSTTFTYAMVRFNTGVTIDAPPAGAVA